MSRIGNDEQFKFLISCIRYSNNGRVDFTEVARECGIVTKGAAAKRYERLMKAHNINPSGGPARSGPASVASPTLGTTKVSKRKAKKGVTSKLAVEEDVEEISSTKGFKDDMDSNFKEEEDANNMADLNSPIKFEDDLFSGEDGFVDVSYPVTTFKDEVASDNGIIEGNPTSDTESHINDIGSDSIVILD
ncbi:MAG: hypothetical protein M1829_001227 [Trizodia sp. TS-e1964]|nr:MAG: hypothetical protein M1829_001227 [Trizodia sp. TS-e1964]